MPRKNRNARRIKHTKRVNRGQAVLIKTHKVRDNISPGYLVAAAEWRAI